MLALSILDAYASGRFGHQHGVASLAIIAAMTILWPLMFVWLVLIYLGFLQICA